MAFTISRGRWTPPLTLLSTLALTACGEAAPSQAEETRAQDSASSRQISVFRSVLWQAPRKPIAGGVCWMAPDIVWRGARTGMACW